MAYVRRVSVLVIRIKAFARKKNRYRRLRTRMRSAGHLRQIERITTNENSKKNKIK